MGWAKDVRAAAADAGQALRVALGRSGHRCSECGHLRERHLRDHCPGDDPGDVYTPAEPPVGSVLETRDDIDEYRIERTVEGWAIQYRDGENEFGHNLTSSRVSWRAAWKAWGPPVGAEPFVDVPEDAPPLPARESAPDASGSTFDPPPPAESHQLRRVPSLGAGFLAAVAEGRRTPTPTPTPPTTATNTGATMTHSIGGAAAGIRGANDIAGESQGILSHAIEKLQEARQRLMAASAGSAQADVGEAMGLYERAIEAIREAQGGVAAAQSSAESVAARL